MKLAEALMARADMQNKLMALDLRISSNLKVQEGQEIIEDPNELLKEYKKVNDDLIAMIQAINKTNSSTVIPEYNMTIADALAKKEQLLELKRMYENVASSANSYQTRMLRTEIKYLNVVDVKKLQKMADDVSKEYRLLDAKVQETNWLTELL